MLKQMQFGGEVAIVTGAGGGIGQAASVALTELGATIVAVGRTESRLRETEELVQRNGGSCHCYVADVSVEADVQKLAQRIGDKWGRVKAVINNVGNNFRASITELTTDKWQDLVGVNLNSVFYMCRAFIPLLLNAEKPSILNIASSFAVIGNPRMPVYCATKGALLSLSRQLAVDYGAQGLRVNALCPGPTLSPRVKGYIDSGQTDRKRVEAQVVLNRYAECDEIGNVAAFLVSDAASFVHGATIVADGGQTIR